MAVIADTGARRARITSAFPAARSSVSRFVARIAAPHKAALANLRHIPLTVSGLGSIDFAAFHLAHGWGWLVTGLNLILLEHMIADEDGGQ